MYRRLFIAINFDAATRRAIADVKKKIENSFGWEKGERVRFMPEKNWHITISFLGTQDDANLPAIVEAMRTTARDFSTEDISFTEIIYGPWNKEPRMIWLTTSRETSRTLGRIKNGLESLLDKAGVHFERESREFFGHITLARLPNNMPRSDLPAIERKLTITCPALSLFLMEAELGRRGATYAVLQEAPFSKTGS